MILVTGATGFLGSELARQLIQQGLHIRCTRRKTSVLPKILAPYSDHIDWVEADILDVFAMESALEGISQVYHCAAWVSFVQSEKEPMIRTNIRGTANLVNLCTERGIRLLHVSSIAAIAYSKLGEPITEKHYIEEKPTSNVYAISKLESEMEVWRGIAEGLNAVIVNPAVIIGPEAGIEGSGKIFETIRKGLRFYTRGSCGFVDVADVVHCMIALMNSDIEAERFIISAENWNYKDLTKEIAHNFGVKAPSSQAKPWMLEIAWRATALIAKITGKDPAIDKIAAQSASIVQNYDNSKIKKAIGIEFKPIKQTIKEICATLAAHQ